MVVPKCSGDDCRQCSFLPHFLLPLKSGDGRLHGNTTNETAWRGAHAGTTAQGDSKWWAPLLTALGFCSCLACFPFLSKRMACLNGIGYCACAQSIHGNQKLKHCISYDGIMYVSGRKWWRLLLFRALPSEMYFRNCTEILEPFQWKHGEFNC